MEAILAFVIVIGGIIHVGTVVVDGQSEEIATLEHQLEQCEASMIQEIEHDH